jgi:hypothetical protein
MSEIAIVTEIQHVVKCREVGRDRNGALRGTERIVKSGREQNDFVHVRIGTCLHFSTVTASKRFS